MREKNSGNPYINLWFGNFFEPAFSSEEFRTEGIDRIRDMGFNSILLDSKAWQDFFDRYAGQEATQYVAAQEHMISEIQKSGLSHCFLAIYLNGDNLYPNIRYSPPVFGEETTAPSGEPGKWYKYWSERAQASMTEHVKELYALYGKNATRVSVNGTEDRLPLCSMWDPIVAFSFDKEGISRYQTWLEERYGSIEAFNQAYGLSAESFSAITCTLLTPHSIPALYSPNGACSSTSPPSPVSAGSPAGCGIPAREALTPTVLPPMWTTVPFSQFPFWRTPPPAPMPPPARTA